MAEPLSIIRAGKSNSVKRSYLLWLLGGGFNIINDGGEKGLKERIL